jgi:hypothetical protein
VTPIETEILAYFYPGVRLKPGNAPRRLGLLKKRWALKPLIIAVPMCGPISRDPSGHLPRTARRTTVRPRHEARGA